MGHHGPVLWRGKKAPITKSFMSNFHILHSIFRRNTRLGWSVKDLHNLASSITVFKKLCNSFFKTNQPSSMWTTKCRMLEPIVQDINRLGVIDYMMTDVSDNSYNQFKNLSRKTSKRKRTAMSDTKKLQENCLHHEVTAALEANRKTVTSNKALESKYGC